MGTLYITEYSEVRTLFGGLVQAPLEPPIAKQTVTISGSHAESSAFNDKTQVVRITTDTDCSFVIDTAPVATNTDGPLWAKQTEYRGIREGRSYKVSVISNP